MHQYYGRYNDFANASGFVVDTSLVVCLEIAGWTDDFIRSITGRPEAVGDKPRRLLLSPTAYQNSASEFPRKLTTDYALWADLIASDPSVLPGAFGTTEGVAIQGIIRQSRQSGRAISRADAEEVYLAGWHGFVLLTGDNRQAEIAVSNGVIAVHKFTALEYLANAAALPDARRCAGLASLIANSNRGQPCALPPNYQNRLREIRRQKCLAGP